MFPENYILLFQGLTMNKYPVLTTFFYILDILEYVCDKYKKCNICQGPLYTVVLAYAHRDLHTVISRFDNQ